MASQGTHIQKSCPTMSKIRKDKVKVTFEFINTIKSEKVEA